MSSSQSHPDSKPPDIPQQNEAFRRAAAFVDMAKAASNAPAFLNGLAKKEEKALEGADQVRKEVHSLAIRALRWGATLLLVVIVVRVWHLIGPSYFFEWKTRWLTDAELQSLDKMLFSSAFGGVVLGYLKEIMRPQKKD